ncbi:transporter substrate-binding domain-containing protein [Burkholderia sp. Ac-20353]|uniref:transporter substrate-binding domain-containing protein n=1 Tax=Burkholderia sp. Ac-20353 TaxID=2703894 RepID=UPI00197C634D|nr:transporter substrate-binding domain-containing protein [Burkholderia sp. Ac-20353]MBN3788379.1 transporter substrate-binding domain-containing protein [Burkholderia sp. Ac-20353]
MKRLIPLLLAASAAWTSIPAHAGATLQRVEQTHVMRIAVVNTYPPMGFIDDSNQLAGFDIDVAKALAQRLGVKLVLDAPAWETLVGGRWSGRWDACICSMTPNAERVRVLDFATPYYSSPAVLVVNRSETRIKSAADLTGKKVGVGTGSSYESYLQKTLVIPGAKPIAFPFGAVQIIPGDESVAFENLALGAGVRLDAVVSDLATANARIRRAPVFRIAAQLYAEPNWVVTEKGDPEWKARLAAAVQSLRTDGTLSRISLHWLGEDVTKDLR